MKLVIRQSSNTPGFYYVEYYYNTTSSNEYNLEANAEFCTEGNIKILIHFNEVHNFVPQSDLELFYTFDSNTLRYYPIIPNGRFL